MATTVDDDMLSEVGKTDAGEGCRHMAAKGARRLPTPTLTLGHFGKRSIRIQEPEIHCNSSWVHWNDAFKMWIVTRYDDSVWIVRRHEVFSNAVWVNASDDPYPPIYQSDKDIYRFIRGVFGDWLTFRDRPSHYDIRRILQQYFTPRHMEKWRSLIRSTVHELIDDLQDADSMDLVRDFAAPLPTLMIQPR